MEILVLPGLVLLRDSKHPDAPPIELTPAGWRQFVERIKSGDYPGVTQPELWAVPVTRTPLEGQ